MGQVLSEIVLPEGQIRNLFDMSSDAALPLALSTAGIVFMAELGDKSFFIAMVLASNPESSKIIVFLGCVLALFINAAIASLIGFGLANSLDTVILHVFTALLFMGFAVKMYIDSKDASAKGCESLDEAKDAVQGTTKKDNRVTATQLFMTAFLTNFVSEIGDKTQLAVLTQASKTTQVMNVLIGACIGFAAVTGLAVSAGNFLSNYLTERGLLKTGSVLFFVFGVLSIFEALQHKEAADIVYPAAESVKNAIVS